MKTNTYLLFLIGLLLFQCTKVSEVTPAATKIDYDKRSIQIMQEVSPSLLGDWKIRRLAIKAQPYQVGQRELKIVRDTVFQDFATLSIRQGPSRRSIPDPRYANFEGFLRFRTKTYPVQFELMASPNRIVDNTGPQAIFLLDYNFPPGSHPTEPEEMFLQYIGFMQENFSLEIAAGQPTMIWRGSNRGIDKIELQKQ